ncbi:hypothetical protein [Pseudoclavibacter soli]|uniref:hypothetical protein n=1 Tax=Pseudoclavibacter soli TaxID=452623 RepID=UPI0003FACF09|nr:hypothetical protein [Pseudoclavibacter soli]
MTHTVGRRRLLVVGATVLAAAGVVGAAVSLQHSGEIAEHTARLESALSQASDTVRQAQEDNNDRYLSVNEVLADYSGSLDTGLTWSAQPGESQVMNLEVWELTACLESTCRTVDAGGDFSDPGDVSSSTAALSMDASGSELETEEITE